MTAPFRHGNDTSEAAARSIGHLTAHLQAKILSYIVKHIGGVTYDEVCRDLELEKPTVAGRLNELVRAGLIKDSAVRRMTRSGRKARVYVATEKGKAAA